jgi:hypothetical protein
MASAAILIVGGTLLAIAVFGSALFFGITYMFTGASGWTKMAQYFRAPAEPQGYVFSGQTVRVGIVRYRWSTRLIFSPQGLYLRTGLPMHPPLLIPWPAITAVTSDTLYWFPAVTLTIGDPRLATITVFAKHWPLLQQFLPQNLPPGPPTSLLAR